jgi:outer membrane receptor protein involved in Fe transport
LGYVGNDKLGTNNSQSNRFIFLQEYAIGGGYPFGAGDNFYTGIQQGPIANENVTWETARKQNIGFEADFLNGMFGLNMDYFYEYRKDILTLIDAVTPQYVGATFKPANIGETENQGFELEFRHNYKTKQKL